MPPPTPKNLRVYGTPLVMGLAADQLRVLSTAETSPVWAEFIRYLAAELDIRADTLRRAEIAQRHTAEPPA